MPEPTPTTDVASEVKGKKLPKWAWIVIIGGGAFALLWYKKHKEESEQATFQPAETGGQTSEQLQTLPGGIGGAAAELQRSNTAFLEKYLESEQEHKVAAKEGVKGTGHRTPSRKAKLPGGRGSEITGTKGATAGEESPRAQREKPVEGTPVVGPSPKATPVGEETLAGLRRRVTKKPISGTPVK